jgi:hypothetical protein
MKRENGVALSIAGVVTIAAWVMAVRSATSMSFNMPMPGGWSPRGQPLNKVPALLNKEALWLQTQRRHPGGSLPTKS